MFADELPGLRAIDSADDQREDYAARQTGLEVRSYRLLDSHSIGQLPYRYELHHPESDSDRPVTISLVARRMFAGENSDKPLFVAIQSETNQLVGALQCRQRDADERWILQYLTLSDAGSITNPAPVALLEHAISQAGSCGARRIMARSEIDSPLTGALRATGFSAFAHEYIYAVPVAPVGQADRMVRMQAKSDVWSIHQLYLQTTPRDVQNAEAYTSHEWDLDLEGRSRRGWLIADDSGVVAYVRVKTQRKYHRLDALFVPDKHHVLETLLDSVFASLRLESPRPVFVAVRGYQQEMTSVLAEAGFKPGYDQLMMVRYTTVSIPVRHAEGFELLPAAETNSRRVPSFYVRDVREKTNRRVSCRPSDCHSRTRGDRDYRRERFELVRPTNE